MVVIIENNVVTCMIECSLSSTLMFPESITDTFFSIKAIPIRSADFVRAVSSGREHTGITYKDKVFVHNTTALKYRKPHLVSEA